MDDLISREDALKALDEMSYKSPHESATSVVRKKHFGEILEKFIMQQPFAQKKGHWRNYEGTLTCSVCETEIDNGIMEYCGDDVPMFCPNCGADMRGNEDAER